MIKCLICHKECDGLRGLSSHIKIHNISGKDYYDKYLKKEGEGICPECGKKTNFLKPSKGYYKHCSHKCSNKSKEVIKKKQQTYLDKYGVDNPNKCKIVREKIKQTCLERFGVLSPFASKEIYEKKRQSEIKNGNWVDPNDLTGWELYKFLITRETHKHINQLYENWDGLDYYTKEKLITNEEYRIIKPNKHISFNKLQPTIDHKISKFQGFQEGILPMIIGHINNLCICSKSFNSKKGIN